jgi:hypothetical protein
VSNRGPGSDEYGAVGAGQRGTESRDRAPIDLTDFLEPREVVDESGMNHAFGGGGPASQAVEIFDISSVHFRTGSNERLGARVRAREPEHFVTCFD